MTTGSEDRSLIDVNPELYLGIAGLSPETEKRYAALRSSAGSRALTLLAAQDCEFTRRQGESNWGFVQDVLSSFHGASLDGTIKEEALSSLTFSKHATVSKLSLSFLFPTSSSEEDSGVSEEFLEDLSGVRATSIWLDVPPKTVFQSGTKTRISTDKMPIPHLLVGHKVVGEDQRFTDVLLAPIVASKGDTWSGHDVAKEFTISKGSGLSEIRMVWLKKNLLLARMATANYTRLIGLQDAILSDGLSQQQVEEMHDEDEHRYVIDAVSKHIIRAKTTGSLWRAGRAKAPNSPAQLARVPFTVRPIGTVSEAISPESFLDYNVVEDVERAAAMLGWYGAFKSAINHLIETARQDPTLKLINSHDDSDSTDS